MRNWHSSPSDSGGRVGETTREFAPSTVTTETIPKHKMHQNARKFAMSCAACAKRTTCVDPGHASYTNAQQHARACEEASGRNPAPGPPNSQASWPLLGRFHRFLSLRLLFCGLWSCVEANCRFTVRAYLRHAMWNSGALTHPVHPAQVASNTLWTPNPTRFT